jgi:hypothetical protein
VKSLLSCILILAICFQLSSKLIVIGWFLLNRVQLTELFCINKQQPQKECNGKCYLGSKLKETDENSSQNAIPLKWKWATEEVWIIYSQHGFAFPVQSSRILYAPCFHFYFLELPNYIFQPPRV